MDPSLSSRLLDQCNADTANARLIREMIFRQDAELEPDQVQTKNEPETREKKKTA